MSGKDRFVYRGEERDVESVARRARQSSGSFEGYLHPDVQLFKPKEGECCVRILPPTWKDLEKWGDGWEIQAYLHYGIGPDNSTYVCPAKMSDGKKPCPICEARRTAADEEEANDLRPNMRCLCWVIDRDNQKAGPQVWSMPVSLFRDINTRSIDKKTNGVILIDHPDDGYDVTFVREGTKLRTKYNSVDVERDPSPIHENIKKQEQWLDYIAEKPLPDMLVYFDAEHLEKVLFGQLDRRRAAEEEGEDASPRRARRVVSDEEEDRGVPGDDGARRRSSRRAEPGEEPEDAPRSRRGRTDPEPEDDAPRSRGRGREEPADEAPRRGRAAPEEPEDDAPRRRRGAPAEEDDTPAARGGRIERHRVEDDETEVPRGRRRATPAEEPEDEAPRSRRGRPAPEPEENDSPSRQARTGLNRLRERRGAR